MEVKGYLVGSGYFGWVEQQHKYMLFATEKEYHEYISEDEIEVQEIKEEEEES